MQLLRNDAAGRIPPAVIALVEEAEDVSVACLDEEEDPLGLSRSWLSTAIITIEDGAKWRVEAVVDELISSYVDQGWEARELPGTLTDKNSRLTSATSFAEIEVTSKTPAAYLASPDPAAIEVLVYGPCVATDGAQSDEVTKLEGR